MKFKLAYNKCPHGIGMISLDDEDGGTKLTNSRCCGRWTTVKSFTMDKDDLLASIKCFKEAVSELKKEEKKK